MLRTRRTKSAAPAEVKFPVFKKSCVTFQALLRIRAADRIFSCTKRATPRLLVEGQLMIDDRNRQERQERQVRQEGMRTAESRSIGSSAFPWRTWRPRRSWRFHEVDLCGCRRRGAGRVGGRIENASGMETDAFSAIREGTKTDGIGMKEVESGRVLIEKGYEKGRRGHDSVRQALGRAGESRE